MFAGFQQPIPKTTPNLRTSKSQALALEPEGAVCIPPYWSMGTYNPKYRCAYNLWGLTTPSIGVLRTYFRGLGGGGDDKCRKGLGGSMGTYNPKYRCAYNPFRRLRGAYKYC